MKKKPVILPLLITGFLGLSASGDKKISRNPDLPIVQPGDRNHEMQSLILAKRFCVTMRRNYQEAKAATLLQFIDPAYLARHEITPKNLKIVTFPLLNIHNIQVSEDPNTILCLVDSQNGTRHTLLLRISEAAGKLFLNPLTPPDQDSGTFSPWILKTEIKELQPVKIREKQPFEKRTVTGELSGDTQNVPPRVT